MTKRRAALLAWSIWLVTAVFAVASFVVGVPTNGVVDWDPVVIAFLCFLASFSIVGALVAARLPGNAIGWLMSGAALVYAIGGFSVTFLEDLSEGPYTLPERLLSWPGTWVWNIGIGLGGIFLVLLFPTGHLPSSRWRPVLWAAVGGLVAISVGAAFVPGPLDDSGAVNPLGWSGGEAVLDVVGVFGLALVMFALCAAVVAVAVRFRRSRGVERLQLKWLTYAGALVAVCIVAVVPLEAVAASTPGVSEISNFVITLSLSTLPSAVGVAILRHRLYAIDRIINRTLVYGVLSAILVAGYALLVLVVQGLLPVSRDTPVAVALSTLAMAGLFGPLRARIQTAVDRRFYRSTFNASRTVDEFAGRLREETDLDDLTADLIAVVRDTMHPTHASLWLRPDRGS